MGKKGCRMDYYRKNQEVRVNGFKLSITASGAVYNRTDQGMQKLDSLWQKRISTLSIDLPNGEEIRLIATKDGLKTEDQIKNEASEIKEE